MHHPPHCLLSFHFFSQHCWFFFSKPFSTFILYCIKLLATLYFCKQKKKKKKKKRSGYGLSSSPRDLRISIFGCGTVVLVNTIFLSCYMHKPPHCLAFTSSPSIAGFSFHKNVFSFSCYIASSLWEPFVFVSKNIFSGYVYGLSPVQEI